jgi:hypothetical protein
MTDDLYAEDLEQRPLCCRGSRLNIGECHQGGSWSWYLDLDEQRYHRTRQPGRGSLEDHLLPDLTAIGVRT